jgi:CheY-like chemotaxis protein
MADATQIQQIVINLCTNASQAMQGQPGEITVRVQLVIPDAALQDRHPGLRTFCEQHPDQAVCLSVSDNGCGMDADTLTRIFEPFFTTKPVDEGTGLGLSVVHGIVQAHQGVITVDSQPGVGTCFALYLAPIGVDTAETLNTRRIRITLADTAEAKLERGGHILYIDDDESLVLMITRLMERRGYRVSGFSNQQAALSALRAAPTTFDVVITDYNMPGMSGLDVAREVHAIRNDLRVAVVSGFIDESLRAQAGAAGVQGLIFKAMSVEELCEEFARLAQTIAHGS